MFGLRAVLDGLKRASQGHDLDIHALLGILAEQEEAALALQRGDAQTDVQMRELVQLYESSFGMPPTGAIANEIQALTKEISDVVLWRSVFAYAANHNKRSWPYVRKLLQNPSPDVFLPQPVNDIAKIAFDAYRKRVNRTLDASVAHEINQLAHKIGDVAKWTSAFDRAAAANALRWDYIKKVLTSAQADPGDAKRKPASKAHKPGTGYRRPQVAYTDEQRVAAEERARQRRAHRASNGS